MSAVHFSFAEGLRMIELDETRIRELKAERADLRRQKKRIEKIYESLDGAEAKVYQHDFQLDFRKNVPFCGLFTRFCHFSSFPLQLYRTGDIIIKG